MFLNALCAHDILYNLGSGETHVPLFLQNIYSALPLLLPCGAGSAWLPLERPPPRPNLKSFKTLHKSHKPALPAHHSLTPKSGRANSLAPPSQMVLIPRGSDLPETKGGDSLQHQLQGARRRPHTRGSHPGPRTTCPMTGRWTRGCYPLQSKLQPIYCKTSEIQVCPEVPQNTQFEQIFLETCGNSPSAHWPDLPGSAAVRGHTCPVLGGSLTHREMPEAVALRPGPGHTYPMYCSGWLWWITILHVGQVLFSSKYLTRQLRQTAKAHLCQKVTREGDASTPSGSAHTGAEAQATSHVAAVMEQPPLRSQQRRRSPGRSVSGLTQQI